MAHTLNKRAFDMQSLSDFFRGGIKNASDLMVGVEWEKIGVYRDSAQAIPYSGPKGVEAILKELVSRYQWEATFSDGHIISLKKKGTSITLEPGGQIELSGQKAASLKENANELYTHLDELKKVSDPMGIVWLGTGIQPMSRLDDIEWVPKKRYAIMREYLKDKGELTHHMMKKTASIQVSIDYTSEADAIEKFRLATLLAPIFSGIFANSPVTDGKPTGFYSMRCEIWRRTDPNRTGLIETAFDKSFSFDAYREYALDVPMFFIIRQDKWIPMEGMTFRSFMKNGYAGFSAIPSDWETHLTTLFTEVRLKTYIEIRSIDCQKKELGLSVPALIKGIFYNDASRNEAIKLTENIGKNERQRLMAEVPSKGLYTHFEKGDLWDLAGRLILIAENGLSPEDKPYLAPLKRLLLEEKRMPAEQLLKCFDAGLPEKEKIAALICCAAL